VSTVLVVDDDATIRQFLEMALTDQGYPVVTAEDGRAALEAVDRARPDLILLDMRMPVLDGWGFAEAYRRTLPPHAPIIVLTAARNAAQYAGEIRADAFLAKPFELRELLRLVRQFTGTPRRGH
jgi:two-component system, chemotaxis family, chemotaxis protein CheY